MAAGGYAVGVGRVAVEVRGSKEKKIPPPRGGGIMSCFSPDGAPEVDDASPEWGGLVLVGGFLVGCQSDLFVFGFGVYFPSSLGPFDCGLAVADFSRLLGFGCVICPNVHCSHHPFPQYYRRRHR